MLTQRQNADYNIGLTRTAGDRRRDLGLPMTSGAIFLDVQLPSATTWFYMSLGVVIAVFFRFRRAWQLRNWDLLLLFILVPPLLTLREAQDHRDRQAAVWRQQAVRFAATLQVAGAMMDAPARTGMVVLFPADFAGLGDHLAAAATPTDRSVFRAYLWLLIGTAVLWLRCLIDLALFRRSAFSPNLTRGGLIWLGLMIFLVMAARPFLPGWEAPPQAQTQSLVLDRVVRTVLAIIETWNWTPAAANQLVALVSLACHLGVILTLVWIGWQHFGDSTTGIAAGVCYLLVPYTAYHLTTIEQVMPALLVVLAVAAFRLPFLAGLCLALGGFLCFFPFLLVPLWISFYRRAGLYRLLAGLGLICFVALVVLLADRELSSSLQAIFYRAEWQPWIFGAQPSAESLWTGLANHYVYRLPLFVAYAAFLVGFLFWPSPKHLGHLIALAAGLILGVQFWYADAGGIYVQWYLPLLILMVFRPTLNDRVPQPLDPVADWRWRLVRWVSRRFRRRAAAPVNGSLARLPKTPVRLD